MRITLTVTEGPHQGRVFTFSGHDTFLVGRAKHAHFQLPGTDRYFSRVHFLVETNPPQCCVMDLGSRNGTYVNGQKVRRAPLEDGDLIKAGRTILRVSVDHSPSFGASAAIPSDMSATQTFPSLPPPPHGGKTVRLAGPPTSVGAPALAADSEAPSGACRVCRAALAANTAAAGPEGCPGPLCPACSEAGRMQLQSVPGYWLFRRLGGGSMGAVYQAIDLADGNVVAIKTILPAMAGSRGQIERFLREADILRRLDHPRIVRFRAMGENNGSFFFAMDFIWGIDAEQLLRQEGPLAIGRAVRLICQLLEALEYAHGLGFVHRDIKPANLLLTSPGPREQVHLADFGLARMYQESRLSGLTMTGEWCGTLPFMPPEHITAFRDVQPTGDQYSAAATVYMLLTNRLVYDLPRDLDQQMVMLLTQPAVPIQSRRADVPKGLARAIHRALARQPQERYESAAALRAALLPFAAADGT
jgi:serine/threonine-protein kinase